MEDQPDGMALRPCLLHSGFPAKDLVVLFSRPRWRQCSLSLEFSESILDIFHCSIRLLGWSFLFLGWRVELNVVSASLLLVQTILTPRPNKRFFGGIHSPVDQGWWPSLLLLGSAWFNQDILVSIIILSNGIKDCGLSQKALLSTHSQFLLELLLGDSGLLLCHFLGRIWHLVGPNLKVC